jgi:glycosyltransferase involved in cell wall biosynthesis
MHCGLPVVAANSSSNPEIVKKGGEVFNQASEIPQLLEKIVKNYYDYVDSIKLPTIEEVGKAYYDFIQRVYAGIKQMPRRRFTQVDYLYLIARIGFWKTIDKINNVF